MNIIEQFNETNTVKLSDRKIEYIVIHYTAGTSSKQGKAKALAKYYSKELAKMSADFIVDDIDIVQYNPDIKNIYTLHCNDKKSVLSEGGTYYEVCTNENSIGIEICSTNTTGKVMSANDDSWQFTKEVLANSAELIKYLMVEYNISADNVIRHYDVTGKLNPGIIGWNPESGNEYSWYDFKNELLGKKENYNYKKQFEELTIKYNELTEEKDNIQLALENKTAEYDILVDKYNEMLNETRSYMTGIQTKIKQLKEQMSNGKS